MGLIHTSSLRRWRRFSNQNRRPVRFILMTTILLFVICAWNYKKLFVVVRDVGYLSRPIWDWRNITQPSIIIPQYYSPKLVDTSTLCELHGWKLRSQSEPELSPHFKLIDAFIFSIELDMLEIRLKELWDVVDIFLVLEATRTFTGQPKELYLSQNMDRFEWAKNKLRSRIFDGLVELPSGEGPFYNEIRMRREMDALIKGLASNSDLIIVSDVDEIPRRLTVELLKTCEGYPPSVHLQLTNYMYSFEYHQTLYSHWRPRITVYDSSFAYHHGPASDYMLADAGWHCSFCFPHLSDFVFKMTSYSHTDRLTDPSLAEYDTIQKRICNGEDIFNMYPEVYTFKDLFTSMGPIPKTNSVMFVPNYVVENANRFKYLLPGGCVRS